MFYFVCNVEIENKRLQLNFIHSKHMGNVHEERGSFVCGYNRFFIAKRIYNDVENLVMWQEKFSDPFYWFFYCK